VARIENQKPFGILAGYEVMSMQESEGGPKHRDQDPATEAFGGASPTFDPPGRHARPPGGLALAWLAGFTAINIGIWVLGLLYLEFGAIRVRRIVAEEIDFVKAGSRTKCRIGFNSNDGNCCISLFADDKCLLVAGINATTDSPHVTFYDKSGRARLESTVVNVPDRAGKRPDDGSKGASGMLSVFGARGQLGLQLGVSPDDKASLRLNDSLGRCVVALEEKVAGNPDLWIRDGAGDHSIHAGITTTGPSITVYEGTSPLGRLPK
jgi:hypothetical protein